MANQTRWKGPLLEAEKCMRSAATWLEDAKAHFPDMLDTEDSLRCAEAEIANARTAIAKARRLRTKAMGLV